jgi:hypothetical protein
VMDFVCPCGDEFPSLEQFVEHRATIHAPAQAGASRHALPVKAQARQHLCVSTGQTRSPRHD